MRNSKNKVVVFLALGMLGSLNAATFSDGSIGEWTKKEIPMNECDRVNTNDVEQNANVFKISDLVLIELEEEVDLGFDTYPYLPKNFNPFDGMPPTEENIDFEIVMEDEEPELGFDTSKFLPKDFNPYSCAD